MSIKSEELTTDGIHDLEIFISLFLNKALASNTEFGLLFREFYREVQEDLTKEMEMLHTEYEAALAEIEQDEPGFFESENV